MGDDDSHLLGFMVHFGARIGRRAHRVFVPGSPGPIVQRPIDVAGLQTNRVICRRILDVHVQMSRGLGGIAACLGVAGEAGEDEVRLPARALSATGKRSDESESPSTKPIVTAV